METTKKTKKYNTINDKLKTKTKDPKNTSQNKVSPTEFIEFSQIKNYIKIKDTSCFLEYLNQIYNDLSARVEESKRKGIKKMPFLDYIKLPIFIGEKLFSSFDRDQNGFLNQNEFLNGMKDLYLGNFEETLTQVFRWLDYDSDGFIIKGDVKILLSYLPLLTDQSKGKYLFQMDSLSEIDTILNQTFEQNLKLSFNEFSKVIEQKKSDVYLQILCFWYQNKPFNENNIVSNPWIFKRKGSVQLNTNIKLNTLLVQNKRLPSPSKKTILSPVRNFYDINYMNDSESINTTNTKISSDEYGGMLRMPNEIIPVNWESNEWSTIIKDSKNVYNSPSRYLKRGSVSSVSEFNLESNWIDMNNESEGNTTSPMGNINPQIVNNTPVINENNSNCQLSSNSMEGELFKLDKYSNKKPIYAVLIGADWYYYKDSNKEEWLKMHNWSACFIKDIYEKKVGNETYYAFQWKWSKKLIILFNKKKEEIEKWCIQIKEAIGYLSFFDFYEMLDKIGEGKFGLVKVGVHKKTSKKVAIKIIKKEAMKNSDLELVKNEIDIMKLCHHRNVVRLLVHFENSDYIFIVMEYFTGGDLENYFRSNNFQFTEEKAATILYQIGSAIKYWQDFGIIHRDLKPGNIMLSNNTEKSVVKIMDFGLSKIVGPQEKLEDGFGTLTFAAPEVLLRVPYNKQIDIWSIGVILFYMLSGTLPFDDRNDNEETIANKIVYEEVKFPSKYWKDRSKELINWISKCLNKNSEKRIQIDDFMKSQWMTTKMSVKNKKENEKK